MKKDEILFVYGTLRKGERADISKSQRNFAVEFLGKDVINGRLYHLGGYPGFKLLEKVSPDVFDDAAPHVYGESYLIKDDSISALIDAYECYDVNNPSKGLYDRGQIVAKSGRLVWVYIYNPMVISDQLIETGDWTNPRLSTTHRAPILTIGRRVK